jgi:hypothetical protein
MSDDLVVMLPKSNLVNNSPPKQLDCLTASQRVAGGDFIFSATWDGATNTVPQIAPIEHKEQAMDTTFNTTEKTPVKQIEFVLPSGPVRNDAGLWDVWAYGEIIHYDAPTEARGWQIYHEATDATLDHVRRNGDNAADIPIYANGKLATVIEADWYACDDCGRCVDVGSVCECRQLQLCDDGYTINFMGEPVQPPEPLHEYDEYGLGVAL